MLGSNQSLHDCGIEPHQLSRSLAPVNFVLNCFIPILEEGGVTASRHDSGMEQSLQPLSISALPNRGRQFLHLTIPVGRAFTMPPLQLRGIVALPALRNTLVIVLASTTKLRWRFEFKTVDTESLIRLFLWRWHWEPPYVQNMPQRLRGPK